MITVYEKRLFLITKHKKQFLFVLSKEIHQQNGVITTNIQIYD